MHIFHNWNTIERNNNTYRSCSKCGKTQVFSCGWSEGWWSNIDKTPDEVEKTIHGEDVFGIWQMIQDSTIRESWLPSLISEALGNWRESDEGKRLMVEWKKEKIKELYNVTI